MEGGDVWRRGVVIVQSQWRARRERGRGEEGGVVHRSQDTFLPSRHSHRDWDWTCLVDPLMNEESEEWQQ